MLEPVKLLLRDHAGIQELLHVQELGGRILRTLSLGGGLLLGSSNESAHIDPKGAQYLAVSYPVQDALHLSDAPFMGLRGARRIEETLWNDCILRRKILLP